MVVFYQYYILILVLGKQLPSLRCIHPNLYAKLRYGAKFLLLSKKATELHSNFLSVQISLIVKNIGFRKRKLSSYGGLDSDVGNRRKSLSIYIRKRGIHTKPRQQKSFRKPLINRRKIQCSAQRLSLIHIYPANTPVFSSPVSDLRDPRVPSSAIRLSMEIP